MSELSVKPTVRRETIDESHVGQRIDNYLICQLKGVPKSRIYRILRKGEVRVNSKRIKQTYRLEMGDEVRIPPVRLAEREPVLPTDGIIALLEQRIIYESAELLVINKPSGLAVHGGSGVKLGLIEAVRVMRPDEKRIELVHRLDRDTSGLILLAKKRAVLTELHSLLQQGKVDKRYLALVSGRWKGRQNRIEAKLNKITLASGERVVRVSAEGKKAATNFSQLELFDKATLVEAELETGRTHQIRVHCQYAGHPILGDEKYAEDETNHFFRKNYGLRRLFLHATSVSFQLPGSGKKYSFKAALDSDLEKIVLQMKKEKPNK